MVSKRKSNLAAIAMLLSLFTLVTACGVDPMYNLDDTPIDPTVTLLHDAHIPIGSSEKVRLDTLIKRYGPEINEYLKEDQNGGYMFYFDGSFSLNNELRNLNIKEVAAVDGISFSKSFTLHPDELNEEDRSYDVNYAYSATIKDFPAELTKLDDVLFDDVYLNLEAIFENLPTGPKAAFDVDLTVGLPEYIKPNTIAVKGTVSDRKFTLDPVKLEKISGVEIPESGELDVAITVDGCISASSEETDISIFKKDIIMTVNASLQNSDGKIAIAKAKGIFSYDFNQVTTVQLGELPDALKDDRMCIDLTNPRISLDINTNIGIPLSGSLEIVPYCDDQPVTENIITLENVVLPYSASASEDVAKGFCICNNKSSVPDGYEFIKADLSKILKQVPDSIQIRINGNAGGGVLSVVEPKAEYKFDVEYGITVPLSFGEDFSMTAETEIDMTSVQKFTALGDFGITGQVVNETPLSLSVKLDILDGDGKIIPQSKENTLSIGGKGTSDIEFFISPSDKSRAIAKARLTISITAVSDEAVKPSECLQFINLVAVIPEGVTIDPELLSEL